MSSKAKVRKIQKERKSKQKEMPAAQKADPATAALKKQITSLSEIATTSDKRAKDLLVAATHNEKLDAGPDSIPILQKSAQLHWLALEQTATAASAWRKMKRLQSKLKNSTPTRATRKLKSLLSS